MHSRKCLRNSIATRPSPDDCFKFSWLTLGTSWAPVDNSQGQFEPLKSMNWLNGGKKSLMFNHQYPVKIYKENAHFFLNTFFEHPFLTFFLIFFLFEPIRTNNSIHFSIIVYNTQISYTSKKISTTRSPLHKYKYVPL